MIEVFTNEEEKERGGGVWRRKRRGCEGGEGEGDMEKGEKRMECEEGGEVVVEEEERVECGYGAGEGDCTGGGVMGKNVEKEKERVKCG